MKNSYLKSFLIFIFMILALFFQTGIVVANQIHSALKEMETICLELDGHMEAAGFAVQKQAKLLIQSGSASTDEIINEISDKEKNESYRYFLIEILGAIQDPAAFNVLKIILEDETESGIIRQRSAITLGKLQEALALGPLLNALDDQDPIVRMGAAKGLGYLKNEQASEKLISKLQSGENNENVNLRICFALGKIGGGEATDAMLSLLSNPNPSYRFAGVKALGRIKNKKAVPSLTKLLKNENSIRRGQIIKALGQIGGEKAKAAIIEEIQDGDPLSVGQAADALIELNATSTIQDLEKAKAVKTNQNNYTLRKIDNAINKLNIVKSKEGNNDE